MPKDIEVKINRFDGGITDDPRDTRNVAQITTNFNALSNPYRLIPYRDSEAVNSGVGELFQNFCVALRTGTTYSLYALGVVSDASQVAEVKYKNLTTGGSTDLSDATWATTSNNASSAGAVNFNLFVYYKKTGKIYGARAGQFIWAYTASGGTAWADGEADLTSFAHIAQGIVHSKDDILYVPYDNKIAKNDNGSWTIAALTLPTHYVINSICEFGNYLAIGCAHVDGVSNSRVFLWDRDSSLTTLSDSIDWGGGALMILEEVDGVLIGISQKGGVASTGLGLNSSASTTDRIIFRRLQVSGAVKFKEIITGVSNSTQLPIAKRKVDNRLFFMMSTTLYGAVREGVWSVGRTPTGEFTLIHERTPKNDTALTSGALKNFYVAGDYVLQAFLNNSTYEVTKTNDQSSYTATSIYETKVLNEGDSSLQKKLIGITATFEALPTAGQVVVKYKKDEETSFTTIFTESTDNAISHSAINIESTGVNLPEYKEITLRVESTGGAVITGLSYKARFTEKKPY